MIVDKIVEYLKPLEGFRAKAYRCPAGVWTIGYGETLGVKEGMMWTEEYAAQRLRARVLYFLYSVYKYCPQLYNEPEHRAVACVLLAYNIGIGAWKVCSVNRRTREGNYLAASKAFLLWNKAGGKPTLTKRRIFESNIYLYGYR